MCLAAGQELGGGGGTLGESMAVCQIESRVGPLNGTFNSSTETDRGRKRERGGVGEALPSQQSTLSEIKGLTVSGGGVCSQP